MILMPPIRVLLLSATLLFAGVAVSTAAEPPASLPNILWLSSEDHGPHMGCYGDSYASTPHVDALASKGMLFKHAWSCGPVCAAARTTIISGLYPQALGAEHMRSQVPFPGGFKMYPQFLREAGYYCTNNSKEDYNLTQPGKVWDESSKAAHWKKRPAPKPFFAIFNSNRSHESQIRTRPHKAVHDPAKVRLPAYHPDTPEVRQDWAQYYDVVSEADADAGQHLAELASSGLAEDTIVFYWADHGSGMPRSKRWPSNSGLHVPLVVYFPEKWRHLAPAEYAPGAKSDRLVSFVDFAPTLLSLAGIQPPAWMHGHAFAGKFQTAPQPFIHGFRGRMDERTDLVRSVTDGRYVYLRNYMPHLSQAQHVSYQFQTPTTQIWWSLFTQNKTSPAQSLFWQTPKAPEELYDLQSDPDEVINLAASPSHSDILAKLRSAQRNLATQIRDTGFLPEAEVHARSGSDAPFALTQNPDRYNFNAVFEAAERASLLDPSQTPTLVLNLADRDSGVRFWAATGLLMRGRAAVEAGLDELRDALRDPSPSVRVAAAEALVRFGPATDRAPALNLLASLAAPKNSNAYVATAAWNALDAAGEAARPVLDTLKFVDPKDPKVPARASEYPARLKTDILSRLEP
jgi:arylsulfatase A-like enzyme